MIAYLFAGQGSPRMWTGTDLFAKYPQMVQTANGVLGYPVEELWTSGDRRLNQTEHSQPAIFVVNALAYVDIMERTGLVPDYLLGHSLGELNALHAAGVFNFETGVRIVKTRGELMGRLGGGGTMAALRGNRDRLVSFLNSGDQGVYLASDSSPREIVVAGTREAIAALRTVIARHGLGDVVPLSVSGPFHSPLMQRARDEFASYMAMQGLNAPTLPVIANVSARPYRVDELATLMVEHLVRPVQWFESVRYLLNLGPMLYQEVGPRRVLSSLIQETSRSFVPEPMLTCD